MFTISQWLKLTWISCLDKKKNAIMTHINGGFLQLKHLTNWKKKLLSYTLICWTADVGVWKDWDKQFSRKQIINKISRRHLSSCLIKFSLFFSVMKKKWQLCQLKFEFIIGKYPFLTTWMWFFYRDNIQNEIIHNKWYFWW